jgi:hypothetical protein
MNKHSVFDEIQGEEIVDQLANVAHLSEMERRLREWLMKLGKLLLQVWLVWLTPRYHAVSVVCPHCEGTAEYVRQRQATLRTMFGIIGYRRAYYLCRQCQRGHYPLDEKLGLRPNGLSAEVERLAGLVGVQMPFEQGSTIFEALTLVKLSDHSMAQATRRYGQQVVEQETEWQDLAQDANYLEQTTRTQNAPLRLYGALDGGRVLIRPHQTEPQRWRELKVGAWFTARGQPPRHPDDTWSIRAQAITYFTDIGGCADFGELMWASGVQRHAHHARELIFLGDGARWIWDMVDFHFPNAVQIVDWFHACEYLMPVAKSAFADQTQQKQWVSALKTALWQGRLDTVIAACAAYVVPQRPDDPAHKAVTYYTNNRQRMDYPTYRAQGYQIGSGTIESGVKQIASQRMKVAGARWNFDHARLVAKARAAFLSQQWDALTAATLPAA